MAASLSVFFFIIIKYAFYLCLYLLRKHFLFIEIMDLFLVKALLGQLLYKLVGDGTALVNRH